MQTGDKATDKAKAIGATTRVALTIIGLTAVAVPAAAAVEEIIVTAQRREQNIQDVPVAVSAFSAGQITSRQIDTVQDIGQNVPNLQTTTVTAGADAIQIHARGASVQNPAFNLAESPVGVYVDDVYYGRLASVNVDLLDIDRIEVLRGPQGTLYGRNTIAGAVKFITRTPGDEKWLTASLGIGNYETTRVGLSLGGPIADGKLAGSIAGLYDQRNKGWQHDPVTGKDPGEYDNKAARAKLHWYGSSNFDAVLTGWISDVKNDGYNAVPYMPFCYNDVAPPACNTTEFRPAPAGSQPKGGFYDTYSADGVNYGDSEQAGANLHLRFDLGFATLRSITGYANIDTRFGFDLAGGGADFGPVPAAQFGLRVRSDSTFDQFSQEFQLLGNGDGNLEWQLGAYYLNEDGFQQYAGIVPGLSASPIFDEGMDSETNSYAVYGQATYRLSERFSVTGGARWTRDDKEYSDTCTGIFCTAPFVALKDDWDETTFKLSLDYQPADNQLVYLSWASGFQAGGFRTLCFGDLSAGCGGTAFDPETVDSFELGFKSDLADRTVRLNAAVFYAMYSDIQQVVLNSSGGFPIDNIGDVDVYGLELEVAWTPIADLNVHANLGLQDSDFGHVSPNSPPGGLNGNAVPVKHLPGSPRWQGKIGFDYSIPLENNLAFFYGLDVFHTDDYYSEARNLVRIDDYTRVNGFLGLRPDDRHWELRLSAKNITDEEDNVSGIFSNGFTNMRAPLPPAEYLLEFRINR